jgi:hypothetical protein
LQCPEAQQHADIHGKDAAHPARAAAHNGMSFTVHLACNRMLACSQQRCSPPCMCSSAQEYELLCISAGNRKLMLAMKMQPTLHLQQRTRA